MRKETLFDLENDGELQTIHKVEDMLPISVGTTLYIDQSFLSPVGQQWTMYIVKKVILALLNDNGTELIRQRVIVDPWDSVKR